MNPELPKNPGEELELRITALLLGELSEDEAANLRQSIAQDAELSRLHDRLKFAIELTRETTSTPAQEEVIEPDALKLAPERRAKLLAAFAAPKIVKLAAARRAHRRELLALAAMLAVLLMIASVLLPSLAKSKTRAQRTTPLSGNGRPLMVVLDDRDDGAQPAFAEKEKIQDLNGADRPTESPPAKPLQSPPARYYTVTPPPANEPAASAAVSESVRRSVGVKDPESGKVTGGRIALPEAEVLHREDEVALRANVSDFLSDAKLPSENRFVNQFAWTVPPGGGSGGGASGPVVPQQSVEEWTRAKKEFVGGKDGAERKPAEPLTATINLYSELNVPPVDPATGLPVPSPATGSTTFGGGGSGVAMGQQAANRGFFRFQDSGATGAVPGLFYGLVTNAEGANDFAMFGNTVALDAIAPGDFQTRLRGIVNRSANAGNVEFDSEAAQKWNFGADGSRAYWFDGSGRAAQDRSAAAPVIVDGLAANPGLQPGGFTNLEGKPASGPAAAGGRGGEKVAEQPVQQALRATSRVEALQKEVADLKKIAEVERRLELRSDFEESEPRAARPATPPPVPQPEIFTAENRFSTFSLNVSDVSFKLAAASLEKGVLPEPATVRTEEFINAFDYRDPEPTGAAPIAFAFDRARYPFAHDRDLVRFSVKTAASGRDPARPLNLVLLLDNSGSMERADRLRIRQECLRVLGSQLQTNDRISVIAFARTPQLWVDGLPGNQGSELPQRVGGLTPQGGTNLEEAMNLAYQTALRHFRPEGVNRVVLLTDGAANLGDVEPESLKKKVEANRRQGIALDCFGIGWEGFNDDLLEVLSRNGDGRYGFVNTPEAASSEFAGQLAGALKVAASDVKVQVEFNPRRVTAYRQMGYAKHQLTKEQFRDNTVDAAEIGAAEAGNALYVVQVNPGGEGPLGTVRVRFKVPGTQDYREQEWTVVYDGAAKPLEEAPFPMRLAATAGAFSEWLVSSPYAAEVGSDRLLRYLSGVPESCPADPRPKKLEWMIRQAKSVSGK